jgi:CPA2 family monovalent cation:H+ antiporter-2
MDAPDAVERVVAAARAAWPHVPVYARARDAAQARRLHAAGAAFASPETIESALQLGEALLNGVGVPDETARRIVDEQRDRERTRTLSDPPPSP